ncbi:hypothetical protein ABE042_04770 [Viridibacillus arvi]|uniref:hypothetical protein n=1 Tax=Viridibacillus arvi TaxID=263475 RepID=UPI003D2A35C6
MKKLFKIYSLLLVVTVLLIGCSNATGSEKEEIKPIIDATQFSRISSKELISIMGKPESIEKYEWSVPKTGKNIVGKIYIYEKNKYEFILFKNKVTRLNVYSGTYMDYDDSKFGFKNEEDIFSMFDIKPNENIRKVADSNYALRFSPVSDNVADVWIQEIKDNTFGIAKITYNLNYF